MSETRAVVVGAGMAGLVSALRLAHAGVAVTVVEQASHAGGKLRGEVIDGQTIDAGPTVFTMRWVFDELLQSVGADLDSELQLQRLPVLARHFWGDGSALDLFADPRASEAAVEAFAGAAEAARFQKFCATTRALYDEMEAPFMRAPLSSVPAFMLRLGPRGLALLTGIGPLRTLWSSMERHFTDPRLQQLFGRYATYTGSSPWAAPATLSLITQVEMDGVWAVQGGMTALARCLERLCVQHGVVFRFNTGCQEILMAQGRASGVRLDSGDSLRADAVVFNGDAAALRQGLLGTQARAAVPVATGQRSLSALTWSVLAKTRCTEGRALDRHNLFFGPRYASEFEDIFTHGRLPQDPTVYVCAQDRGAGSVPEGHERLLCLVNAPAVGDRDSAALSPDALERCQERSFAWLRQCGLEVALERARTVRTSPNDFHQRFPATGGALYGQATHGWLSIFSRPGAACRVPGLYLAGGSTHPGPGVPMAALSGRLAAEAVLAHLASTRRLRPAATSGGMSMPAAMTAPGGSP
ncbi:CrtD protein [Rhodoferax lacus]|uniref:CrtD protein n=1 Tax=Rhodoferax lacus TaxID=2184758 RepID=A0A3E1RCD2_9BURK|nr:1-hydroxycarotenoid 3,4-desaturase CrtD [Rhodoferax lacus]RFO97024.1 CrtD protein [Rhodoferax lacus]